MVLSNFPQSVRLKWVSDLSVKSHVFPKSVRLKCKVTCFLKTQISLSVTFGRSFHYNHNHFNSDLVIRPTTHTPKIIIFPKGTTFNTQNFRPAAGILLKGTTFNTQNFPACGRQGYYLYKSVRLKS